MDKNKLFFGAAALFSTANLADLLITNVGFNLFGSAIESVEVSRNLMENYGIELTNLVKISAPSAVIPLAYTENKLGEMLSNKLKNAGSYLLSGGCAYYSYLFLHNLNTLIFSN